MGSNTVSLGLILVISLFGGFSGRFAEGVPHFVGLVAIAVPSIANESATGMLVLARWSVAGADVGFARSNAY